MRKYLKTVYTVSVHAVSGVPSIIDISSVC